MPSTFLKHFKWKNWYIHSENILSITAKINLTLQIVSDEKKVCENISFQTIKIRYANILMSLIRSHDH